MECPRCKEWISRPTEHNFEAGEAVALYDCDCGCRFDAFFLYDHCEVIQEPPEPQARYQTQTERDNPRDTIIERS